MKLDILSNVFLKEKFFLMELAAPLAFKSALPGQFLHIRIEDSYDPLLRRPMSIHNIEERPRSSVFRRKEEDSQLTIKILCEVTGKGTKLLSEKGSLSQIDVLGPLGNGFDIKALNHYEQIYIVGGGAGVAPLFFLAKKIMQVRGLASKVRKPIVLIGARTKNDILCEKEFVDLGCQVHVATEDGSGGFKGKVTELLAKVLLSTIDYRLSTICACGPKPMLATVAQIACDRHLSAFVSLEEFMGCGLGACLGCVIQTTSGYKRICHDGPVFNAAEIIWKE